MALKKPFSATTAADLAVAASAWPRGRERRARLGTVCALGSPCSIRERQRVAMPGFGLILGAMSACPISAHGGVGGNCDSNTAAVIGLFAGIALASLNDAAWLSYDAPRTVPVQSAQFGLAPFLSQDGKRAELRAYGTF